jgi:hypothetical protein
MPELELVCVYTTGDAALVPIIESLFDDGEIEFWAKGEDLQDLFAWGRFGTNYNVAIGPIEFYVRVEDSEEAKELLSHLQDPAPPVPEDAETGEKASAPSPRKQSC